MSAPKITPEDWLDWADGKADEFERRGQCGSYSAAMTAKGYRELRQLIEDGMAWRARGNRREVDREALLELADAMGDGVFAEWSDAIDGGWAKQLRAACGRDAASDASPDPRDVAHMLDMAAFEIAKASIAVSDMLSDLAQSVKSGDRDLSGFKERWLK